MRKSFSLITLSLLIGSLFFISCSTNHSTDTAKKTNAVKVNQKKQRAYDVSENEAANTKLVEAYVEAIMNANGEKVKSLVNDGFYEQGPSITDSMTVEEAITFWKEVNNTSADQKAGIFYTIALRVNEGPLKGEWVDVWGNYTAVDKKTQQNVIIPWHSAFFIENNKISYRVSWWDNLSIALQVGDAKLVTE